MKDLEQPQVRRARADARNKPLRAARRVRPLLRRALPRPAYYFARGGYYRVNYGLQRLTRKNPGRGSTLPDFLVIGPVKGGTTSLYGWLREHPFVAPAVQKEVHYFDYNFHRGEDWYRSHFPLERTRREFEGEHGRPFLTGEASPAYISHHWAPLRVAKLLPEVKLIAVLRNPADRAHSHYQMARRDNEEDLETFEEALAAEEERLAPEWARVAADPHYRSWAHGAWSYATRSRYAEQLERWFEFFPRERFLILKSEELWAEPQPTLDAIYDFLGLPPHRHTDLPRLNAGHYEPMSAETRARLADYFRPHNTRLYEVTGIDFGWDH